ncbi:DUF596 domain-containing protein [Pseudomonas aeruginosa]|uniref:DUF596 domain-containing protein n=1 Tax=Pseudomonas aeruginosa TaxID=287 RepID=UPI0013E93F6F
MGAVAEIRVVKINLSPFLHDGLFLVGTIQDQLNVLKDAWPEYSGEDDLDGFGLWFVTEAPAGVVWIDSDGKEFWT